MSVISTNQDLNLSIKEFWTTFKLLPDSELIAFCSALKAIYCQAIVCPPNSILEFGTGIGTISAFLRKVTLAEIVTVEKDSRFLAIARKNLENYLQSDLTKSPSIKFQSELTFDESHNFDWIIIDGSVGKQEWQLISEMKEIDLFIIENQRFISRFKVLNILLRKKVRFQYSEIDTADETGIAVFKVNQRGSRNSFLFFLDYVATCTLLFPRFAKGILDTRGRNLFIN